MDDPWYRDGLRFRCSRCGHCCTGAPGFVWVNQEELADLANLLQMSVEQVKAVYTRWIGPGRSLREKAGGDCIFYDRKEGCTVYAARPRQCRTWPFWESRVADAEAWAKTCEICPGSGQGDLIPADEITRRLRAIKL
jgi:uncharacterized protein